MLVTVAICTFNRAGLLDRTLAQMQALVIPDGVTWELLVVNNNCTDGTDDVIVRHLAHLPIRRLFEAAPGLSNARNRALEEAGGDVILWTDDDVLVDAGWLAAVAGAARRHPGAAGFAGPIIPWFPVTPSPRLVKAFPALGHGFCGVDHGMGEQALHEGQPVFGANMAFRRSALAGLRFNPQLGAIRSASIGYDDTDVIEKVRSRGGQMIWLPEMRLRHYVDADRMKRGYLATYYMHLGEGTVRRNGVPPGPRILGVPRWLLRKWAEAALKFTLYQCTPCRVRAWTWQRYAYYHAGMIRGCVALRGKGYESRG